MAVFRVSIRFEQTNTRSGGWSQNHWINTSSIATASDATRALIFAYTNGFVGQQIKVPRYRISPYGVFRQAQLFPYLGGPATGAASLDADYPTTKLQVKFTGQAPTKTYQWFGGIQDGSTTGGGFWTPTDGVQRAFMALQTTLTSGIFGWSILVNDPSLQRLVVVNVDATTGTVTTATNHGFSTNDYVRIQRVNGIAGLNGVWQVNVGTVPTQFTLIGWKMSTDVMTKSNGRVQKQSRVPQQITAVDPVQITSHRVGRPQDQLGGKRKKRSKWLAGPLVVS
jgi:hypothetical protein